MGEMGDFEQLLQTILNLKSMTSFHCTTPGVHQSRIMSWYKPVGSWMSHLAFWWTAAYILQEQLSVGEMKSHGSKQWVLLCSVPVCCVMQLDGLCCCNRTVCCVGLVICSLQAADSQCFMCSRVKTDDFFISLCLAGVQIEPHLCVLKVHFVL